MKLYPEIWHKNTSYIFAKELRRSIRVDIYFSVHIPYGASVEVLLFNDGQLLEEMDYLQILKSWHAQHTANAQLFLTVGIHAGKERTSEYGTAGTLNESMQGDKAAEYQAFILDDLPAFLKRKYPFADLDKMNFAGFSLGGLAALDTAWSHPAHFDKIGVFSGSFWWRVSPGQGQKYSDSDRIMHERIRNKKQRPPLRFFFECGTLDESNDRNNNGIIDAIDDTLDLIIELKRKGYTDADIRYVEIDGGRHSTFTWGKCMPEFLSWGWLKQ